MRLEQISVAADLLREVEDLAGAGQLDLARERLREFTQARVGREGLHREWGLLAERLGLVGIAEREFNLALRDDPQDALAVRHLYELAEERGAVERAANLLARLVELEGKPEDAARLAELYQELGAEGRLAELREMCARRGLRLPTLAAPSREEDRAAVPVIPPDADLVRFLSMFGGREDVYARQWYSPQKGEAGYSPVRQPLTIRELRSHLLGEVTLGVYPIRLDGTCLFCALDLDIRKDALAEARKSQSLAQLLRKQLAETTAAIRGFFEREGLVPIVEDSGYKGRHFWFPLAAPEPAGTLVTLGRAVLECLAESVGEHFALEWFPKASRPGTKGLGNLIKLPLGVHRRTGRRSAFLDAEGKPVPDPFGLLRTAPRLGREAILAFLDRHRSRTADEKPLGEGPEVVETTAVPLPPRPLWTQAHFEANPSFRALLAGCAVLRHLVQQALEERRLSYDEAQVVVHTFGYLPQGVQATNYLLNLVPGLPENLKLKSPLRGNPISCVKIRAKIGHLTSRVPCNCTFPGAQDHYPSPVLHTRGVAPGGDEPPQEDMEALLQAFLRLQNRMAQLAAERQAIQERLVLLLRQEGGAVQLSSGLLRLEVVDGVETLRFEAASQQPPEPPHG